MTLEKLRREAQGCANTSRLLQLTLPYRRHGERIRFLGSGPLSSASRPVIDLDGARMMAWWDPDAVISWLDKQIEKEKDRKRCL